MFDKKSVIGVVALQALPGSPNFAGSEQEILDIALSDISNYAQAGVDAIKLINDYDIPYIKPPLPAEALRVFSNVAREARSKFVRPIGIEIVEGANESALEIAVEAQLDFVRVHAFVFASIGISGLFEGCAGQLVRKRKGLNAEHVKFFADIKKKHCSHAITSDLDIIDEAIQAEQCMADGLIVTGARSSESASLIDVTRVKKESSLPVWIGSGVTVENIEEYYALASGFIVGSHFRTNGSFLERLDRRRLDTFMEKFLSLRENQM